MTRINCGIPPANLSDKHLLAEHREIKRIPNHVAKHWCKIVSDGIKSIPKEFVLGKGHVRFFFDKGEYTFQRYQQIYIECIKRGFKVTYYGHAWDIYEDIDIKWYKDYTPTFQDISTVLERIHQRTNRVL